MADKKIGTDRDAIHRFMDNNYSTPAEKSEPSNDTADSVSISATNRELRLCDMVGLDSVRSTIESVIKRINAERILSRRGLGIDPGPMNFVFIGNPGTAKTTVAHLMAKELHEMGVLPTDNVVCAGRKDIIGKYEGQTTANMKRAFKKASGGVLFIDEAYSLVEKWNGEKYSGYGKEAIDVLVEELGMPKSDRVVILAGYPDEMNRFIDTNPGLSSRLNYRIEFPDYDAKSLYSILQCHAQSKNLKLGKGVKKYLLPRFESACGINAFGNGRFVVNLLNKAINKQRARLYDKGIETVTAEEAMTLKREDFADIDNMIYTLRGDGQQKLPTMRTIGFLA